VAALKVGNTYEELGILVKSGIIDKGMFLDRYSGNIVDRWDRVQYLVEITRESTGVFNIWENFEYLAVLSEDWNREHPSTYPKGVRQMPNRNRWPVAAAAS
jgi:hypothetical protein